MHDIKTNKQNSRFAQHILDAQHNYNPIDQSMSVLGKEKKGQKLNTLERFYIYDLTKKGLRLNDACTVMHNPIFDVLIKQTNGTPHMTTSPNHAPTSLSIPQPI
jgi:hypothetical protein